MNITGRIMAERTRLIRNADEAFVKKLEVMLWKQKEKQVSYGGTIILVLLILTLGCLFVLLMTSLSYALLEFGNGNNVVEYKYSQEKIDNHLLSAPINSLKNLPASNNSQTCCYQSSGINTTIIQPVQEVIKERVVIGQQKPCLKIITERGTTYVCET